MIGARSPKPTLCIIQRIMMLTVMRTTISLDDDLLAMARQQAATLHLSLSEVINRALRRGLGDSASMRVAESGTVTYGAADGGCLPNDALRSLGERLDDQYFRGKIGQQPSESPAQGA